ncbi:MULTISPECIES: hypothetical protein [Actinopolyspora]|uniref:hypothetical protein n=1 Tax=Actinopolyspora TaxID=1849 RepID=UPI000B88089C|nr:MULTISPECIES: hypothetical protein [Actinopolyspora]NHD15701.1 hypothetical protein [Actinopolyspora sp. BKK2]NHE75085.1 hypothetical protein [Actinopolyspora sp. BKK1]
MKRTWLFVVSLAGTAVSASVVLLRIPPLFESGEQGSFWLLGGFACLTVGFAVGMRRWRPTTSSPQDG